MGRSEFLLVLGPACLLACWIAYRAWANRGTTGARSLAGVALAAAVWAGGTIGLTLATSPAAEFRWLQFMYVGVVGAPIGFIILALQYTGHKQHLTRWSVGGLLALGAVVLGLAWTNPYHELYWANIDYSADVLSGAATRPALGFWGFVVFTYTLLLLGSLLLIRYAFTAPHLYRSQTIALLIGVAAPWAANIPYALQFMSTDLTPVALSVMSVALWVAMFRYRFADLGPIALRTVFENIATGVYVLDAQDRLVDVNAAGKNLLNVPDDAIGTPLRDLAPDETFYEHVRDVTNRRDVIAIEGDPRSDSEESLPRYYEVQVTPIDGTRRPDNGRIVVVDEVTDQYRRQKQLEEQNERLEAFASVVSHDLRNPLNVASGNLMLARENGDGDHLARVDQALHRMEALIDDLLALAHGGSSTTEPESVELEAVVDDAWATVDTKDATLDHRSLPSIVADRSRLRQLIANLLRNAIEHGGASVTVTIGNTENGFYVADDGPGIPPDKQDRVFDAGYSTREAGTGLGLNIVREIADAHGWDVRATDSAEGGASFEITNVEIAE
ncbi:MAG: histidine kinase N-terminal 7TM domain-containing protein [Salinibacter sp.]